MACEDAAEASRVGHQLSQVNTGCLITYRRAEDILLNSPLGKVAMIVLASGDDPEAIGRMLTWMRHRWPRCPVAVIGDSGGGEMEMAARKGGACYLTRPVAAEQWAAMVEHVLRVRGPVASEKRSVEESNSL
jgi:DNA-binding NtrC family response regulator